MKKLLSVAVAITAITTFCVSDVSARERSGAYATGKGKTGTYATTTTGNLKTGLTKQRSYTTQDGKTRSSTVTQQYDKKTGAFTKTVTGENGKSVTYTGTGKNGVRTGTYTTSDGKTGTFDQTVTKNENGGITKNTTATNAAGKSITTSTDAQYNKDTGTLTTSTTGPKGNVHDGSVTFTPDKQQ